MATRARGRHTSDGRSHGRPPQGVRERDPRSPGLAALVLGNGPLFTGFPAPHPARVNWGRLRPTRRARSRLSSLRGGLHAPGSAGTGPWRLPLGPARGTAHRTTPVTLTPRHVLATNDKHSTRNY